MKTESYFIGLDIGTSSVGWAVTDKDLNLIKTKNKNFWGVRMFDAGETAEKRRLYRSERRRIARRKQRITLLQDFFEKELNKVDPEFINKLNHSWVSPKDEILLKGADFVFDEKQTKEKEIYYSKFPTIWHLREHLLRNPESQVDIRWIYLAIHHIIKHRGNFLYTDSEFKNTESAVEEQFEIFIDYIERTYDVEINSELFINKVKKVLLDVTKTLAEKKELLKKELKDYKPITKQITQFINAILGYSTNFHVLFDYDEQNIKGYITEDLDDEKYFNLINHLGPDVDSLNALSQIYSWSVLRKLLSDENNQYISYEMVNQYEEYSQDLKDLKALFAKYSPDNKNKFFKSKKEKNNYYNYNLSKKDVLLEDLYKNIDKLMPVSSELAKDERYQRYLQRKSDTTLLKVQNTTDKGAIPYQLHLIELKKIIENQGEFYPFLKENEDKIVSILSFRIPYYVGPLNNKSEFSWIQRTNEKIYPWNFEVVVNRESSEEEFIKRMVGNCTYLTEEKALPLESLTYQEYILLNELNTVRVNNRLLEVKTKLDAVEQLFKKNKTVTINVFKKWLEIYFGEHIVYEVTGLSDQNKFNGSLSSWVSFSKIGIDLTNITQFKMAEDIISWATIFSDKKTLRDRIEREYPSLSETQVKQISQLNFKGWGRLSNRLLSQLKFKLPDNTETTIIERMRITNENFMQIINNKELEIAQQLENEMVLANETENALTQIKELPGSPAIKKGIHQAVLLVEEISNIMGGDPEKIFLEFAREDQEKKRTTSRYNQLEEIYNQLKKEKSEFVNQEATKEFSALKSNHSKLSDEKIFLYFMQNGRCLYSGREIDYNFIFSPDLEVDHIIPRSYTKDNSFSNKALVYRNENQKKKDNLLLEESIIKNNQSFWYFLRKKDLMSEKKYRNLTRDHISLKAKKGFINRQLVETRQISKHVKNLLINLYPETKIQTLKSQFISDYRRANNLYKLRSLNDYHHAHDAYLSMFLGEFIDRKIPWINNFDPLKMKEYDRQVKSLFQDKQTFNRSNKYGLLELINKDSERIKWNSKKENSKVKKYLDYKDCYITYKVEEKTGEFYKQNPLKVGPEKKYPIKKNMDPKIYGGYSGRSNAYFSLVGVGNKIKAIPIPIEINSKIKTDELSIEDYIKKIEPKGKIIREKILINTLFEYQGHPFIAKSASERVNGKQILIPKSLHKLLYSVENEFDYEEKKDDFENYLNVLISKLKGEFKELANSSGFIQIIDNNYEELLGLEMDVMNSFINESLYYFQTNSQNPNFKIKQIADLQNRSRFGRMGNPITDWKNKTTIIDQSITGYYESRLKL